MSQFAQIVADSSDWNGHMGWSSGWWAMAMIVFMAATIAGVTVWASSGATGRRPSASNALDPARAILAERYASGELTLDEYRERASHL